MTLSQMRSELIDQGARLLTQAEGCDDPKLKAALIGKAEATGRYVQALSPYCKPESQA